MMDLQEGARVPAALVPNQLAEIDFSERALDSGGRGGNRHPVVFDVLWVAIVHTIAHIRIPDIARAFEKIEFPVVMPDDRRIDSLSAQRWFACPAYSNISRVCFIHPVRDLGKTGVLGTLES